MQSSVPDMGSEPEFDAYESPAQLAGDLNVSLLGALGRAATTVSTPIEAETLFDDSVPYDGVVDRIELLSGRIPLRLMGSFGLRDDPARFRLAVNLAERLAQRGRTVTVVDASLLGAGLAGAAGAPREGLMDMLLYGCSYQAAAQSTGIQGLSLVTLGSHPWSGEPIHTDDWERVLGAFRQHSDLTLLVGATELEPATLSVLARRLDSIVLAYGIEDWTREVVRRSYLTLWDMDAPILGVVTEGPPVEVEAEAPPRRVEPLAATAAPPALGPEWSKKFWDPAQEANIDLDSGTEIVIRESEEILDEPPDAERFWSEEVERILDLASDDNGVPPSFGGLRPAVGASLTESSPAEASPAERGFATSDNVAEGEAPGAAFNPLEDAMDPVVSIARDAQPPADDVGHDDSDSSSEGEDDFVIERAVERMFGDVIGADTTDIDSIEDGEAAAASSVAEVGDWRDDIVVDVSTGDPARDGAVEDFDEASGGSTDAEDEEVESADLGMARFASDDVEDLAENASDHDRAVSELEFEGVATDAADDRAPAEPSTFEAVRGIEALHEAAPSGTGPDATVGDEVPYESAPADAGPYPHEVESMESAAASPGNDQSGSDARSVDSAAWRRELSVTPSWQEEEPPSSAGADGADHDEGVADVDTDTDHAHAYAEGDDDADRDAAYTNGTAVDADAGASEVTDVEQILEAFGSNEVIDDVGASVSEEARHIEDVEEGKDSAAAKHIEDAMAVEDAAAICDDLEEPFAAQADSYAAADTDRFASEDTGAPQLSEDAVDDTLIERRPFDPPQYEPEEAGYDEAPAAHEYEDDSEDYVEPVAGHDSFEDEPLVAASELDDEGATTGGQSAVIDELLEEVLTDREAAESADVLGGAADGYVETAESAEGSGELPPEEVDESLFTDPGEVPVVSGRTPWRVLLIGGCVGLIALLAWAYQADVIRFEPRSNGTPDQRSATIERDSDRSGDESRAGTSLADAGRAGLGQNVVDPTTGASSDGAGAGQDATGAPAVGGQRTPSPEKATSTQPTPPPATESRTAVPSPAKRTPSASSATRTAPSSGVEVEKPSAPQTTPQPKATPASGDFVVHVSSFQTRERADTDLQRYVAAGYTGTIQRSKVPGKGTWYRVYVGEYPTLDEAKRQAKKIVATKLTDFAQARRLKK